MCCIVDSGYGMISGWIALMKKYGCGEQSCLNFEEYTRCIANCNKIEMRPTSDQPF